MLTWTDYGCDDFVDVVVVFTLGYSAWHTISIRDNNDFSSKCKKII